MDIIIYYRLAFVKYFFTFYSNNFIYLFDIILFLCKIYTVYPLIICNISRISYNMC